MSVLAGFLRFALLSIGWTVTRTGVVGCIVATDLHGRSWTIEVTPCE